MVQSHLPPFRNLGNFVHLKLPVSFGRDIKSRWSLLSGVYVRGSKRSHTVVDSVILQKDNSEIQARQYSSHKYVANIELTMRRRRRRRRREEDNFIFTFISMLRALPSCSHFMTTAKPHAGNLRGERLTVVTSFFV